MEKTLVIGLDGVPYTLLKEYIKIGLLPNLERILSCGFNLEQMDASIPDVSSTSWTSFMTGANPGEHGIYGFMELRPGTYKMAFPNSKDIHAPSIWDIIGGTTDGKTSALYDKYSSRVKRRMRSIVLNIPQTFPAMPLNGILTAGFVCPDLKKGTYPEAAYDYLQSIKYLPDIDAAKAVSDTETFFKEAFFALEKRGEAYEHFLKNEEWDFFIGVITETDRLHHFFFDAALDEGHRYHNVFVSFYKRMDGIIGGLFDGFMETTGGKGFFMTMSDHGFTVIDKEVYMNTWLKESGFLKLNPVKEYYEQIEAGSSAFAMDPARIYINSEGKYPLGAVRQGEREGVIGGLKARLLSLKSLDGKQVIKSIYGKEELYKGRVTDKGPDLVCLAHDGFDLKGNLKKPDVFGKSQFRGMHTRHDAHCIMPAGASHQQRLHIEDLAGVILDNLTVV
ncbi:MAG: alkaline phosphatase family protein [Deltaproteobacteria bacterium]|nr:alkaline phosphatase family protein [Deltaproteobacteria bacterium]